MFHIGTSAICIIIFHNMSYAKLACEAGAVRHSWSAQAWQILRARGHAAANFSGDCFGGIQRRVVPALLNLSCIIQAACDAMGLQRGVIAVELL
jgi:hypothetical protein